MGISFGDILLELTVISFLYSVTLFVNYWGPFLFWISLGHVTFSFVCLIFFYGVVGRVFLVFKQQILTLAVGEVHYVGSSFTGAIRGEFPRDSTP